MNDNDINQIISRIAKNIQQNQRLKNGYIAGKGLRNMIKNDIREEIEYRKVKGEKNENKSK